MGSVYVLKLEGDKYYVGYTDKLESRIENHFLGGGSIWTKRNRPLSIEEIHEGVDKRFEHDKTVELLLKHGIDNVRGAGFTQVHLDYCPNWVKKLFM